MPAYKTYRWESDTWPEYYSILVNPHQQHLYIRKLSRHFKVMVPRLRNNARMRGGRYWSHNVIELGHTSRLDLVIHEFAHHLTQCRWGTQHHHDKKFKRELKRCYTFAKRWLPKPINQEPLQKNQEIPDIVVDRQQEIGVS